MIMSLAKIDFLIQTNKTLKIEFTVNFLKISW